MKRRSKEALWATRTAPPRNSSRQGRTTSIGSASATIPLVMPVRALVSGGRATPGVSRGGEGPRGLPPGDLGGAGLGWACVGGGPAGGLEVEDHELDGEQRGTKVVEATLEGDGCGGHPRGSFLPLWASPG